AGWRAWIPAFAGMTIKFGRGEERAQGFGVFGGEGVAGAGGAEDAGEDVAGFDRRELVGVADQDQAGAGGDGFGELGHQREVDHRGFVDDDDVVRQRVVGVVAHARGVGDGAEQAMQGGAGGGQGFEQGRVDAGGGERLQGSADAGGHAFGGAAGGGGERDPRGGPAGLRGLGDEEDEQAGDGGGLAGAGAAG